MDSPDAPRRARLPDTALTPVAGGGAVPLRVARHSAVLVLLDGAPGPEDRVFLDELAAGAPEIAGWDGRVLVVIAGDATQTGEAVAALGLPFPVLADPAGTVLAAAGVAAPALVVADQWGEVHWVVPTGEGLPWPPVAEAEQWARFLAIRCAG